MYLYSIFYNECKPVGLDILKEYSYYKEENTCSYSVVNNDKNIEDENKENSILHKIEHQCMKAIRIQDGLFWSIFIGIYGYNEYLRNKYNYGKLEVNEKQKITEYILKTGSNNLKTNYKITRSSCAELVADLTSLPRMIYSGLIGMCSYYKSDIFVVDIVKNTYIYFLYLDEEKTKDIIVLYKNPLYTKKFNSNEYFVDIGLTVQSIEEIKEKYFGIEKYTKPLNGISTYLKPELEKIAEKTIFQENPKLKKETYSKQELYNLILMYISSGDFTNN
jgi:hypothetical protein